MHITHLDELSLGVEYVTLKGTALVRLTPNEVFIGGGKLTLPILPRGQTYETTRTVSQFFMVHFHHSRVFRRLIYVHEIAY